MKNKIKNIMMVAATVLSLGSVTAFANTNDSLTATTTLPSNTTNVTFKNKPEHSTANFDALVQDGTITQEEADAITSYMETKSVERQAEMEKIKALSEEERQAYFETRKDSTVEKKDKYSEMVEQGIISSETAEKLKTVIPQIKGREGGKVAFKIDATTFVQDGTITQEEADAITSYMETKSVERQAEMEKIKALSEEERQAYFETAKNNSTERKDMFTEMAEQGILSSETAEKLKTAMPQIKDREGGKIAFKIDVTTLVQDGTITQENADAITSYMETKSVEKQTEMEKIKALSEEERQAYFETRKDSTVERKDMFTEMVEQNIISNEVAEKIKSTLSKIDRQESVNTVA